MFYSPLKKLFILGALLWSANGSAEFVQNSVNLADMCKQDLSFKQYNQSLCAEALTRPEDDAILAPIFLSCLHPHFRGIEPLCPTSFIGAVDLPDIPYEKGEAPVWPQNLDSLFTSMLGSSLASSKNLKVDSAFGEIIYDEQIIADLCNEEEEFAKTDLLLCAPHVKGLNLVGSFIPSFTTSSEKIVYKGPLFDEVTDRSERNAMRDGFIDQLAQYINELNKNQNQSFDFSDFKTAEINITVTTGTRYPDNNKIAKAFLGQRRIDLSVRLKNGLIGRLIDSNKATVNEIEIDNSVDGCQVLEGEGEPSQCKAENDEYGTVTVKVTFQLKGEL